jgi:hypothetical protein
MKPTVRKITSESGNNEAWALAEKVRADLDRQSCPGVYMNIAMESIVKYFAKDAKDDAKAFKVDQWISVTKELQPDWLYQPLWISTPQGVIAAKYEWRQGRYPHQFDTESGGSFTIPDVTHAMPLVLPVGPAKE